MMNRTTVAALIAAFAAVSTASSLRGQTPAEVAWAQGDMDTAERLYSQQLAADSANPLALHRVGLLLAWGEKYDRSLELFDRLLAIAPDSVDARIDRARVVAWTGDAGEAARALEPVLASRPGYLPALRAQAQFASWAGNYPLATSTYREILKVSTDRAVQLEYARVLSWAGSYSEAVIEFDKLVRSDPADREARLGLARTLAWANRHNPAERVYRGMLELDPQDREARHGLAQTASWSGNLREGEKQWREVLALAPNDTAAWIGLSQNLRWQGRNGDALAAAKRAAELAPDSRDAKEQIAWATAGVAPRILPTSSYESDSDGNRIMTTSLAAVWPASDWLHVRGDGFIRRAEQQLGTGFQRETRGIRLSLAAQIGSGWRLAAGSGVSEAAGATAVRGSINGSIASPQHLPLSARMDYSAAPLDATALLMERGLRVEELAFSGRLAMNRRWTLAGRVSEAEFSATQKNERRLASAEISHRLTQTWSLGSAVTAFAYRHDLDEGYFDPDFYGLAEVGARWARERGRWRFTADAAPGLQQVGSEGKRTGAARIAGGFAYLLAPGREIGISAGYSSSGMDALSASAANYQYRSLRMEGSWTW